MKRLLLSLLLVSCIHITSIPAQANPLADQTAEILIEATQGFEEIYPELSFTLLMSDDGPQIKCTKAQYFSTGLTSSFTICFSMEFIKTGLKESKQELMNSVCEQVMDQLEYYGMLHYVKVRRGIYES